MKDTKITPTKRPSRERKGAELFISRITTSEFRADVLNALVCFQEIQKRKGRVRDLMSVCIKMGAPKPTKINGLLGNNDAALRWSRAFYAVYNTLRKSELIVSNTDDKGLYYEINQPRWEEINSIFREVCSLSIF